MNDAPLPKLCEVFSVSAVALSYFEVASSSDYIHQVF